MVDDETAHDVKVVPRLIDCWDVEETEILCADRRCDSEFLVKN